MIGFFLILMLCAPAKPCAQVGKGEQFVTAGGCMKERDDRNDKVGNVPNTVPSWTCIAR